MVTELEFFPWIPAEPILFALPLPPDHQFSRRLPFSSLVVLLVVDSLLSRGHRQPATSTANLHADSYY